MVKKLDPSECFSLRSRKRTLRHAIGMSVSYQKAVIAECQLRGRPWNDFAELA
jgi:hypothetical protein